MINYHCLKSVQFNSIFVKLLLKRYSMTIMLNKKPRIMLIGAGKFGLNYVRILKDLHAKGQIDFVGVCVSSEASAAKLKSEHNVLTTTDYKSFLSELDAVCVVTPPETHYQIISDCLPYVHVLSEKPLALNSSQVRELGALAVKGEKALMTAQLFRFHAVTCEVEKIIKDKFGSLPPTQIKAVFVNPDDTYIERPVAFEFIHWFDLVVHLFPFLSVKSVESMSANKGRVERVSIKYRSEEDRVAGDFELGWDGEVKKRTFTIMYGEDEYISADYMSQVIKVSKSGKLSECKIEVSDALEKEVKVFLSVIKGEIINPVNTKSVEESVKIAEQI